MISAFYFVILGGLSNKKPTTTTMTMMIVIMITLEIKMTTQLRMKAEKRKKMMKVQESYLVYTITFLRIWYWEFQFLIGKLSANVRINLEKQYALECLKQLTTWRHWTFVLDCKKRDCVCFLCYASGILTGICLFCLGKYCPKV